MILKILIAERFAFAASGPIEIEVEAVKAPKTIKNMAIYRFLASQGPYVGYAALSSPLAQ